MPATTTRYALQYPVSTDADNVPSAIQTPLVSLDSIIATYYSGVLSARPAASIMGRQYYATDNGNLYFDTGTGWLNVGPINQSLGTIASLAPGNSASVGSSGQSADAAHVHKMPGWGVAADYQPSSGTASAGTTGRIADAGHVHPGDPAGIIKMYAGTTAPSGFVLCDGTQYGTGTYPALFAAIGYQWGGSGANFKVPNLTDRSPIGAGNIYNVGQTGGNTSITLTSGMLPSHTHSINDPQHSHISASPASGFVVFFSPSSEGLQAGGSGQSATVTTNTAPASTGITINATPNPSQSVPVTHPVAGVLFVIRAY